MSLSLDKANLQPQMLCQGIKTDSVVIECGFEFEKESRFASLCPLLSFSLQHYMEATKLVVLLPISDIIIANMFVCSSSYYYLQIPQDCAY